MSVPSRMTVTTWRPLCDALIFGRNGVRLPIPVPIRLFSVSYRGAFSRIFDGRALAF